MDLKTLLDKRNIELFEEVSKKRKITFQYSSENNYACYSKGQSSIIYIPDDKPSIESFTHELLHLYLRAKGMYAGGYLRRMINESKELEKLFDEELINHISNVIDHIKMFPIFISLGFDKEKFIDDFDVPKCTEQEINRLELYHSDLHNFKFDFFRLFVGKFFSMIGCPNDGYNYEIFYKTMDDLDFILLQDLNSFYKEWQSYDINKNDIFDKCYGDIMIGLVVSFKAWNMIN